MIHTRRALKGFVVGSVAVLVLGGCPADAPPEAEPSPATAEQDAPREALPPSPEPDEARVVWVGVEIGGRVVAVDLDAERTIEKIEVPGHPHNVTVAPDGTVAAALQRTGTIVLVRDGDTTTVELGASPHDVKSADAVFVVANEFGERVELVSTGGEILRSVPLRAQPHDVAVAPDGRYAWPSLNRTDDLAVVDLDGDDDVRYVSTGRSPHDLLFAPDGRLWVTDWSGPLHVLSPDGEVIDSISLGREAHHLTFTPDGSEAWVTDHAERAVFVVSTETFEVIEKLNLPGSPHHIAITPDGELAAVADHDSGTLVVFDVPSRDKVATIDVGTGPHGAWAAPGGES